MPCLEVLGIGQISLWPLAGFTGWLWCATRNRPRAAGLLLALTIIKPHLGLLPGVFAGAYSLRHRHWSTLITFAIALVCSTLVTLWLRPAIWMEYVAGLQRGTAPTAFASATLYGWGRLHLGEWFGYVSWALWCCALLLAAGLGWNAGMHKEAVKDREGNVHTGPLIAWSAMMCIATVLFMPYAFSNDLVFLLPGFILAVGSWLQNHPRSRFYLLIWLGLEAWMVAVKLIPWEEDMYWIVSLIGLVAMGSALRGSHPLLRSRNV
jgi:hypothetical protein